jgi:transcriptional regulator with XRE-family HTH domain/tetratricopeptide (TPR) repeat protein
MARTCAAGGVEAPLVRLEATSPHEIKPADPVVVVVGVGGRYGWRVVDAAVTSGGEPFGSLLRRHRLAAVLSQERLAERAGISAAGIAALEAGRRRAPRSSTVALLLDALSLNDDERSRLVAAAAGDHHSVELTVEAPASALADGRQVSHQALPSAPLPDGRSIFVGRADEMERLAVAVGRARVIVVSGEAGVGKSRLVKEFVAEQAGSRRVLWGRCTTHRLGSYEPFVAPIRAAVAAMPDAAKQVGQLARLVPELGDVPGWADHVRTADHEVERRLLFDAAVALFGHLGPTLLVLDDLHWADAASLALLSCLASNVALTDLTIIATVRTTDLGPGTAAALADVRRHAPLERIELSGLDRTAVASLIGTIAGSQSSERLLETVTVAAGGNPLFVEELTEHLIAQGYGTQDDAVGGAAYGLPIPKGVAETLTQRLLSLGDDAQRLVRTGAVLGRMFDPDLAAQVADLAADRVLAATEDALLSGLVNEVSAREVTFSHGLVQSAVYDSLSARRRLDLHRRAATLLAATSSPTSAESTFAIARHWSAVALGDVAAASSAALWEHRAGEAALVTADVDQAIGHFERAAEFWTEATSEHVETLLSLGAALSSRGRGADADERFRMVLSLADVIGDRDAFARAAIGLATTVRYGQFEPEQVALLERAITGLGANSDVLRTMVAAMLKRQLGFDFSDEAYLRRQEVAAIVLQAVSQPTLSRELLLTLGTARDAIMVDDPVVLDRLSRAIIAVGSAERRLHVVAQGCYGKAWAALELADGPAWHDAVASFSAVADELDLPFERALACTMAATTAMIEGRYVDAQAHANQAHAYGHAADPNADTILLTNSVIVGVDIGQARQSVELMSANREFLAMVPTFLAGFAATAAISGVTALARELLDRHVAVGLDHVRRDLEWLPVLGFLSSAAAHLDALDVAQSVYDLLVAHPARAVRVGPVAGWWGPTDHHLGSLCRVMGRLDDADRHLRRSIQTCEQMGARPWHARSQFELARVLDLRSPGRPGTEANDLRAVARVTVEALGATSILEQSVGATTL